MKWVQIHDHPKTLIQVQDHVIVNDEFITKMKKRYGLDKTIKQSVGSLLKLNSSKKLHLNR